MPAIRRSECPHVLGGRISVAHGRVSSFASVTDGERA